MTDKRIKEWNVVMYMYYIIYDCFKRFGNYFLQHFFFFIHLLFARWCLILFLIHSLTLQSSKTTRIGRGNNLKPIIRNMRRVRSGKAICTNNLYEIRKYSRRAIYTEYWRNNNEPRGH